jgi:PIN domain nuclease of toxin-antitoxin system
MTYVLDTHPVVWFLETSQRLSVRARNMLRDPSHTLILPMLVLVEITYLYTKGRIEVDATMVQQRLMSASNCVLYPLDEQVAMLIPTVKNNH